MRRMEKCSATRYLKTERCGKASPACRRKGRKRGRTGSLCGKVISGKAFSRMGHCTISIKNAVASSENSCHRVMALCPDLCYDKEADSLSGFYIPLSGRKYSRI